QRSGAAVGTAQAPGYAIRTRGRAQQRDRTGPSRGRAAGEPRADEAELLVRRIGAGRLGHAAAARPLEVAEQRRLVRVGAAFLDVGLAADADGPRRREARGRVFAVERRGARAAVARAVGAPPLAVRHEVRGDVGRERGAPPVALRPAVAPAGAADE